MTPDELGCPCVGVTAAGEPLSSAEDREDSLSKLASALANPDKQP